MLGKITVLKILFHLFIYIIADRCGFLSYVRRTLQLGSNINSIKIKYTTIQFNKCFFQQNPTPE